MTTSSDPAFSRWREDPSEAASGIEAAGRTAEHAGVFRLGELDALVECDCGSTYSAIVEAHRECVSDVAAPGSPPTVRCRIWAAGIEPIAMLDVATPVAVDLLDVALCLVENRDNEYSAGSENGSKWRRIERRDGRVALLTDGTRILLDRSMLTSSMLAELVVASTMCSQPGVRFFHSASIGIEGKGLLIAGWSMRGKTTLSVTLAAHGHSFLADDVSALHLGSGRLLPQRRAVNLRPGPMGRAVASRILELDESSAPAHRDAPRQEEVRRLFPESAGVPVPLKAVVVLDEFEQTPRLEPFVPGTEHLRELRCLAFEATVLASWGRSQERRMLLMLQAIRRFARVPCYRLYSGDPDATAELLEKVMAEL